MHSYPYFWCIVLTLSNTPPVHFHTPVHFHRYRGALDLTATPSSGGRGTTTGQSSAQGPSSDSPSKPRPQSSVPSSSLGSEPLRPTSASPAANPLVPRVARLASARGASHRHSPSISQGVDHELMAMRVTTAALLSNSFVSCYATSDQQCVGRSKVSSAPPKRSASARIVR